MLAEPMTWLTTDLHLIETDAQQLRLHLGWLVEDLARRLGSVDGQPGTVESLAARVALCFGQLEELDALLAQMRQATARSKEMLVCVG